jgi:tRNA(fMet)-specific endonuclease VapC
VKYLLDANAVIEILINADGRLVQRVADCDLGDLALSSIAYAEVALGSVRGKPPSFQVLEALLSQIELVPFDYAAGRAYATLPFKRASFDRLIAAHALSLGLTLVTANKADFSDIPGLKVENWAE